MLLVALYLYCYTSISNAHFAALWWHFFTTTSLHYYYFPVLEGGYDLTALASSALAHVNALAAGCEKTLHLNKNSKESSDLNKNAKETVNESSNLNEKLNRSIEESSNLNKSVNESVDVATAIGVSARDNYGGDEAAALAAYIADLKL